MKKRILALLLSTAMVISCTLPVYAANESIIVGSEGVPGPLSNDNAAAELETGDDPSQEVPQDSSDIIVSNIPERAEDKNIINPEPSSNEDSIAPPLQPGEENTNNPNTDTPQESESSDETSNEPTLESDKKIMEWGWYYEDDMVDIDKLANKLEFNKEKKTWVLSLSTLEDEGYDLEKITNLLPQELIVTLDGEKDTQQIKIVKWQSETYIKIDNENWPQEGTYFFSGELEAGYSIDESLTILVVLERKDEENKTNAAKSTASKTREKNAIQSRSNSNTVTIGNWTYTLSDGTAAIYSYNGTASSVTVPTTLAYGGINYKLRKIEDSAFENNTALRTVVLPESISSLGRCVFKNCTNLSSITINGNIGDCSDRSSGYYSDSYSSFYNTGTNVSSFKVTFGPSVTRIPAFIFATNSNKSEDKYVHITSLIISDNVTEIGRNAFYNCYDLTGISWSKGLRILGQYSFANNTALKSLSLPPKVTTIEDSVFEGCTNLNTVVLPKATSSLGRCVFKNCTNLSSITINGNIGDCSDRSSGYYSDSYSSFYNTGTNVSSFKVTFGPSVTRIPAFIFATNSDKSEDKYVHITSLIISDNVTEIGQNAFYNCYDLTGISWSKGLRILGRYSFANNTTLKSLSLPPKVTTIEDSVFEGCTNLNTVVLPKATSSLGRCVFKNCTNLSSITINGNIGDCSDRSSGYYSDSYSLFYNTGTNVSSFKVTFGSSVTQIPAFIFATNSDKSNHQYAHIISVTIPASVKTIGEYAFYNCHNLSSVTVSSKTAVIDENAFGNCKSSLTFKCYYYSPIASYAKENKYKISYLDLPKVTVSNCVNYSSGIKITWKKSSSAAGYYIYRRTSSGSYSKVKTITKNSTLSWTDTSVKNKNGTAYYYLVKAYNSSKVSGSATSKKIVRMNGAAISSLSNKSGKKMYVKWKQNSKATGYQIQYSTSKTFSNGNKTTSVSGYKNISKTISGLSKGKTYYVRIRSYKTVSGTKYYSAWGSSKKVRINK